MPTTIITGNRVQEVDLLDLFPADEGFISQIYGRIGSGKTYIATHDVLDLLRRGKVVYVNWKLNYNGYDERQSKFRLFVSLMFPWIKRFYYFPKDNLRYYEFSDEWAQKQGCEDFATWLANITDAYIYADEGHLIFDSYMATRMSMQKRANILHTRHFDRSICVVSQRPSSIHVMLRANVSVFYKCEKRWQIGNLIRFRKIEFQDMKDENVDEDMEKAISITQYWGKKRVFDAYDTKYLRGNIKASQKVMFEAYDFPYKTKIVALYRLIVGDRKIKVPARLKKIEEPKRIMVASINEPYMVKLKRLLNKTKTWEKV